MTVISPAKQGDLSRVATLLDAVGRRSDNHLAALHCLRAVDLLAQVGATASPNSLSIRPADVRSVVAEGLRLLAELPDEVFDNDQVAAAIDAAQAAYQRLG